jgi:RNA polymerase sigma-70 factor (ECF subfamily)
MTRDGTTQLNALLARLKAGEAAARVELIDIAQERLRQMARRMLRQFPTVRRWEDTDDVLQDALLRLDRALREVSPATTNEFLRFSAAVIRRVLIDMARHLLRKRGWEANYATPVEMPDGASTPPRGDGVPAPSADDSENLELWARLHERIASFPEEERLLFDLLWYQGLTQAEAADMIGVSLRTLKRQWQAARLRLQKALDGALPT